MCSADPVWEDGGWAGLPALEQDVTADVCVIGLGGSGLTAVQELRSRGASVVGIDAGLVGGGAAGRNGGFLLAGLAQPHHEMVAQLGRARAASLYQRTLEEIERIAAATPECLVRKGSLRIERTPSGLADCVLQADAMRADGFLVEPYEGPEGSGLLFPDDGALQPLRRCRQLTVPGLYEHTPALSVGSRQVVTPRATIGCDQVLVLIDGGLSRLLREVPVRTVRLQMLATAPVRHRFDRPVYLRHGMEYWQQLPDGRLAVGGFRDLDEDTGADGVSASVQAALDGLLRSLAPEAVVTHRWAAPVGYTHDALPYLGQVRQGVWAAGGYCGTGNVVGALCARQLVTEALGSGPTFWPP